MRYADRAVVEVGVLRLGHHSAAFTLDIYGHLMPDDHEASLRQVEAIFATALRSAPDGPVTAQPGEEGR